MENENPIKDSAVKTLQACLFPPQITTGSYFQNFLIKATQYDDETDDKYKIRESSSKESLGSNNDTVFTTQPSRWPTECQVLDERIRHINYIPSTFEPYYVPTGNESQPKPTGDEVGIIVYQYTPISAVNYFSRSSVGGSKYLLSTTPAPEENSLRFESRFESGNLARAIRITPNYYELHLRSDLYTNRHMQWFYFRVTNMRKQFLYRFSITNCSKENSLFNEGMRPLMYSTKDSQLHSIGWRRCGENITYFCNDNVSPDDPDQLMTYTLSFTVEFPHDDDTVYMAHCYPYTYSDLQDYLQELSTHPVKSSYTSVRLLCKSLAGNNVYYVTITSPPVPGEISIKNKRAVVLSARVHPGETPASWMMKGMLDFLTSDSSPAKELRDKFIFKIVPMINPDGVIVGNNRCSLSAKDLNRQYRTVIRDAYPTIWYTKLMVRRLLEECGVALYCDLHAHSRRHNIFLYGCENRRGGDKRLQEQVFPLMLHKNTAEKFSFESCKFRIQKAKEGTGRVVMWMMGIANSYTMEASFAGSTLGNRVETHFSTQDFEQMGKSFCQTLLDYYDDDPRKERLRLKIIDRLVKEGSNADEPANIRLSDYSSDDGDTSSTSSNEVGRDDDVFLPAVPPPTPILYKKQKAKSGTTNKSKIISKSPIVFRKPLPICKANIKLSLSEKNSIESSSENELENEKIKLINKKRRKKKPKKKAQTLRNCEQKNKIIKICRLAKKLQEHSDSDTFERNSTMQRSISVFDLLPNEKLKSTFFSGKSKAPQPKIFSEKKSHIANQLAEVQAKLTSLKNKLWFGVGNGDMPLSWGSGYYYSRNMSGSPQKQPKKTKKKKNTNKDEKGVQNMKNCKSKVEPKEKPPTKTKKQNGLRRQTAVEWSVSIDDMKIRKSKSLPDTANINIAWSAEDKTSDNEAKEKKKKKKRGKFAKKVKTLKYAKTFTSQKD